MLSLLCPGLGSESDVSRLLRLPDPERLRMVIEACSRETAAIAQSLYYRVCFGFVYVDPQTSAGLQTPLAWFALLPLPGVLLPTQITNMLLQLCDCIVCLAVCVVEMLMSSPSLNLVRCYCFRFVFACAACGCLPPCSYRREQQYYSPSRISLNR